CRARVVAVFAPWTHRRFPRRGNAIHASPHSTRGTHVVTSCRSADRLRCRRGGGRLRRGAPGLPPTSGAARSDRGAPGAATAARSGGSDRAATAAAAHRGSDAAAAPRLRLGACLLALGRRPLRRDRRPLARGAPRLPLRAPTLGAAQRRL